MDKNLVINEITDITVFGVKTDNGSEIHRAFLTINDGNTKSIVSISGNDYEQMKNLVQNIIKNKQENNTALNIESYSENSKAGIDKLEELNNNVDMSWSMKYAVNRYGIATVKENDRTLVVQDELGVKSVTVADEEKIAQAKPSKENKHGKLAAGLAIAGIALAVACGKKKADDLAQQQAAIEQSTEMNNAVVEESNEDVQEVNFENWTDYDTNAKETDQKAEKKLIHDYLMEFNASDDWANKVTITDEEVDQFKQAGYHVEQAEDGKYYATMGLTAEQAEALRIVYSANTNEQIAKELGGAYFDSAIVEQGGGTLDQAIEVLIYNYLNTDQESINIDKIVNLSERTQEVHNRFEKLFYEHKTLLAEGKDEEAKAKFTELADALVDYAHSQNLTDEDALGKNIELNIWVPTLIGTQAGLGYNDVEHEIMIYNDNTGEKKTATVKDDYPLSQEDALNILGWENCSGTMYDEKEYVSRAGFDGDEWHVVKYADGVGILDSTNGVKYEKVNSYNDFIQQLRVENANADGVHTNDSSLGLDENSEYDKLIKDSYDNAKILEFINDDLALAKKNPMNIFYYALSQNAPFANRISNYRETHEKFNLGNGAKATLDFNSKNGLVKFIPGSSYTITHTDT